MKDFKLFDILPNGVIVFKNEKIEYINQYLLDVLSIGDFSIKNSSEIICKILNIQTEEDLFLFFNNSDYFQIRNKIIQIECNYYDNYNIFSFIRINESLIDKEISSNTQNQNKYIDEEVAKHFKLNNIQKVIVLTFYKGIPLKNIGKIIRVNSDSIELIVDSKHNISLLERDDILLITNTKKGKAVLHGNIIESNNNTFVIKHFYLSNDDMHLRNGVRVKLDREICVSINEQEFQVYDISRKGISLYINTKKEEKILKNVTSLKILFGKDKLELSVRYLKTISDNSKILKIIFTITTIGKDYKKLNQYIVDKQNEILREIHQYQENR